MRRRNICSISYNILDIANGYKILEIFSKNCWLVCHCWWYIEWSFQVTAFHPQMLLHARHSIELNSSVAAVVNNGMNWASFSNSKCTFRMANFWSGFPNQCTKTINSSTILCSALDTPIEQCTVFSAHAQPNKSIWFVDNVISGRFLEFIMCRCRVLTARTNDNLDFKNWPNL